MDKTGLKMSTGAAVQARSGWAARARRAVGRVARVVILATLFVAVGTAPAQARDINLFAVNVYATQGETFIGTVACIHPPLGTSNSSEFEAVIDWGDGTTSSDFGVGSDMDHCGVVNYAVQGYHTYTSAGTYTVTVTVTDLVDGSIHTVTGTATVGFVPDDLSLSKGAAPNPVRTSTKLTYTITVSNASGFPESGVVVTDTLPTGVQFVSASTTQGNCVTPAVGATGTITCDLGYLPGLGSAVIKVVVKVVAPGGSTLTNTAIVAADDSDPFPANDSATVTTKVFGRK